jgi:hypothetical protein
VSRIIAIAKDMAGANVTIGAFPEQVVGGYPPEDLVQWSGFLVGQRKELERFAKETSHTKTVFVIGLAAAVDDQIFNTAAIVHRGRIVGLVPKEKLPTYNVFYEGRTFSRGVWASKSTVDSIRRDLAAERATPEYAAKRAAAARRRDREQAEYVTAFRAAALQYLAFHPRYRDLAFRLASAVTTHATPVGSGTVARTERIPVDERAEAAVIAWMRHQTTAYDQMSIPRERGKRREVRRMLAARSKALLDAYRSGGGIPVNCPLQRSLVKVTHAV